MGRLTRQAAAVASLALVPLALPQEPTFTVDVRLVRMLVTVKDSMGKLVGGLEAKDFNIKDNGVRQDIALFERRSATPLSVAILVDTSRSTAREKRFELTAAKKFVASLLDNSHPEDSAALYSFDSEVSLVTPWTHKISRINSGLDSLKSESATALFDAVWLAASDLRKREGRRVLVVISDGGDTASRVDFQKALQAIHAADAVLYAVVVVPIAGEAGRNVRGENALTTLSQWTGGQLFAPGLGFSFEQAFAEILRDLRTQYLIGFYPRGVPPQKDKFHAVELNVNRPQHSVRARNGYYE